MDTLARKTQIPVPDCPTIGLDVRRVMFQTGDKEVSMIPSLLMRGVRQLCNGSAHCTGPARSYTCDRLSDSWLCGERRCEFPPTLHLHARRFSLGTPAVFQYHSHTTASIRPGTLVMTLSSHSAQFWTLLNTPFGE